MVYTRAWVQAERTVFKRARKAYRPSIPPN